MKTIRFNKTSNIFINTGIVALYRYLQRFTTIETHAFGNIDFKMTSDRLTVSNDKLLSLLEVIYYQMGKEIYDTASLEQKRKVENAYYDSESDSFKRFPKMNTYGLTSLLTNNAQGTTRLKENSPKISDLEKSNPDLAEKIKSYFDSSGLKLLSKVYINEPYSKLTTLEFEEKYFQTGDKVCPILGESFKLLVPGQNISPFLSGLGNFNSFLESSERKISQKAIFLIRFSPSLSMFSYYNMYDSLSCSFFNSNNLLNIDKLYDDEFFYLKDEMESWKIPFQKNVKLSNFKYSKKDGNEFELGGGNESYSPIELTFLILHTFYNKKFRYEFENDTELETDLDPFADSELENVPISIVTFKADKFASTMRPNYFEEFSNVKNIIRLFHLLESNKILRVPIKELWRSLLIKSQKSEAIKDFNKKLKSQRLLRESFLNNILKGKSNLPILEDLFSKAFLRLSNNEETGYIKYDILLEFLIIYEPIINFGGITMDKNLQLRAINLGKSIGQSIINYDNPKNIIDKKANAKNGRKYIISMNKARTLDQFRSIIIRVQQKYGVSVANEILENLHEKNFLAIKQYATIGTLNTLNTVLSLQNQ